MQWWHLFIINQSEWKKKEEKKKQLCLSSYFRHPKIFYHWKFKPPLFSLAFQWNEAYVILLPVYLAFTTLHPQFTCV